MSGYDQWLTTQPEPQELPLPGDDAYPRCSRCGAFLTRDPDPGRASYGDAAEDCAGQPGALPTCGRPVVHAPHRFIVAAWTILRRICAKCGYDNEEVDA